MNVYIFKCLQIWDSSLMVSLIRNISIKDILFYLKNRGRIQPVGLGGGAPGWAPNLTDP